MIVRLCFLVSVLKAKGRKRAGGSDIGSTDGFECSVDFGTRIAWTGVLKPGEEDGFMLDLQALERIVLSADKSTCSESQCLASIMASSYKSPSKRTDMHHNRLSTALAGRVSHANSSSSIPTGRCFADRQFIY